MSLYSFQMIDTNAQLVLEICDQQYGFNNLNNLNLWQQLFAYKFEENFAYEPFWVNITLLQYCFRKVWMK